MFKKITDEDCEKINIDLKLDCLADVVNKKISEKLNRLLFEVFMNIKECESPLEQLFLLTLLENTRGYSFNKKMKELNFELLDINKQENIGKYRVDFLILVNNKNLNIKGFIVEIDGHEFHQKTKKQVQRDKEKDRYLISEGYIIVRFTGSEIYNNCEDKVDEFLNIIYKECDRQ